jgi:Arc/MetJ-type ribon-helix-helix transcriptional regulator
MSKQITVRLPDELVDFVDDLVSAGVVASRAEAVTVALQRERRRRIALRDVDILHRLPSDPELEAVVEHSAAHPVVIEG